MQSGMDDISHRDRDTSATRTQMDPIGSIRNIKGSLPAVSESESCACHLMSMGKIRTAETDYRYVLRCPDSGNKAILMGYHMSHSEKAQIH